MTISDKIRVYELSRDLKLENKDILDAAQKLSISVKSHSSSISSEDAKKITNLLNNKNSGKKILSVSKSTLKAKTEKPKNINNQNKDNKILSNTLHPEKTSKENLTKKPLLIKPINKPDNALISPNKKNVNKLENPKPPSIVSKLQSQPLSKNQNKTNNSIKTTNNLKEKQAQRFAQEKKPLNNPAVNPTKTPAKPPIQLIEKPKNLTNPNRNSNPIKKNEPFNQKTKSSDKFHKSNFPKKNLNNPRIKNTPELVGAPIRREDPKANSSSNNIKTSANRPIPPSRPGTTK